VKYHLEAVFTKLGVRSRAEAVTRGLRRGLLVV
jgi:DNA-binding CsgD family transcriptional regulator